ncbi:hypothetical protein HBH53_183350 [Parastagonospora nodorum]|nr:hypothetical protein HBH53_183350 [Parastagonospora nodorum]KAH4053450.1 hypothetical protein HBH49_083830 [Parastagonospora nodorum]KAH4108002.1 hypothetical protein HBH46_053560 [Parastagonospora nodorum]KAH4195993.1 hypothetical protein HBH42_080030 [Parastagonospora nodorum]KAH4220333.1 hypothetical protein HBI06_171290 [Parastagonospora nodorum]
MTPKVVKRHKLLPTCVHSLMLTIPSRKCKQPLKIVTAEELTDKSTQANQIKSPLLELPAEIRGIIYEYFFCDLIVRVNTNEPRLKRYSTYLQPLAPRQLCRQIRCETQSAYFKYTQFYFQNYDLCDSSDKVALPLGDINCSAIQSIKLEPRLSYNLVEYAHIYPKAAALQSRWKSVQQVHIIVTPMRTASSYYKHYETQPREHVCFMFGNNDIQLHINDD